VTVRSPPLSVQICLFRGRGKWVKNDFPLTSGDVLPAASLLSKQSDLSKPRTTCIAVWSALCRTDSHFTSSIQNKINVDYRLMWVLHSSQRGCQGPQNEQYEEIRPPIIPEDTSIIPVPGGYQRTGAPGRGCVTAYQLHALDRMRTACTSGSIVSIVVQSVRIPTNGSRQTALFHDCGCG
jgi:hypothetical protein